LACCRTAEELKKYCQESTSSKEYYWQIVSDALLCQVTKAELTIFVPKITRSAEIMETAVATDSLVRFKAISELPFLPTDSDFPELTRICFEIPESDLRFLEDRIRAAADEKAAKVDEYKKIFGK